MQLQMAGKFAGGILLNGSPLVIPMIGAPLPCTVTLKSAAAGRKIEHSTDGGAELVTTDIDVTSATMLVSVFTTTVANVVLTGAAGDTWDIR
jgi:hypothetical protein